MTDLKRIDLQLPKYVLCHTCKMPVEADEEGELKVCVLCGEYLCKYCTETSDRHLDECRGMQ